MFRDVQRLVDAVREGFREARVLVIGDLMLDRYIWGEVERISPEAPVPVVRVTSKSECAGGAGNVAINLAKLGCQVTLSAIAGNDEAQCSLLNLLRGRGVATRSIITMKNRPTTVKTRIIGGHQQMLRLDDETDVVVLEPNQAQIVEAIDLELGERPSVVILSDYGKGMLSAAVCRHAISHAREHGIPVLVDPKGIDYSKYAGATGISPNRSELAKATNAPAKDLGRLFERGEALRSALNLEFVAVTLSELGIALLEAGGTSRFPALARDVFDVSGAGDTVIATLAGAFAAGLHLHDAIHLANLAAGVVVAKVGTVPITREELLAALLAEQEHTTDKIFSSASELLNKLARWRVAGQKIVFTNGCFDLFHAGHVSLLQRASREGDRLIVGLNTDRSVKALKGSSRPVMNQQDRAQVLAAMGSVDAVVLFDDETPLELIKTIRPEVLVKGGDYREDQVVGASEIRTWNGKLVIVPLLEGLSSSELIRRAAVTH